MSDSSQTPSASGSWVTIAAAIGGFAIFALILLIAYLPKQAAPIPAGDGVRTPEQRKAALTEMHAKEKAAATTYGWVDQTAGVVRIPIDEAVAITIKEIQSKK